MSWVRMVWIEIGLPLQKGSGALRQLAFGLISGIDDGRDLVIGEVVCDSLLEMFGKIAKRVVVPLMSSTFAFSDQNFGLLVSYLEPMDEAEEQDSLHLDGFDVLDVVPDNSWKMVV